MSEKKPWYSKYFGSNKVLAEPDEQRTIIVHSKEEGRSGTQIFAGIFDEDYLRKLQSFEKSREYDKMRRGDARVKMCLNAVKNPIRSASWNWSPSDNDNADAKKHADFLNFIFMEDIGTARKKKFKRLLSEALTCVEFGYSVFERVHKMGTGHAQWGDYVGLANLGWRNPKSLWYFHLNPDGSLKDIEQSVYGDVPSQVKMDGKFLSVITMEMEGDNYEGVSFLRPCFGAWSRKQTNLKLLAIGVEKNAIPTPKVEVPAGKENSVEYTNMVNMLEKLTSHESNFITYPAGWKLEFHDANFDPQKVISAIQFENTEITFAFLANFLELGSGGKGGSYALSDDLSDFFTQGIVYIADLIAEEFEEVGKELIQLNFGPQEKYPTLTHEGIADKIGIEFGNLMKALGDAKFMTPDDGLENEIRRRMKLLPMREEDLGKRDKPAPGIDPLTGLPIPPADPNNPNPPEPKDPNNPDPNPDDPAKDDLKTEPADKGAKGKGKDPAKLKEQKRRYELREKQAQVGITEAQDKVREVVKKNLKTIGADLNKQIMINYRKLGDSQKTDAINGVSSAGSAKYFQEIKDTLVGICTDALAQARKEVPKAKTAKLGEFESLPKRTQKYLTMQSRLMVTTTMADLEKVTFMQFGDAVMSTDSESIIADDLNQATDTYLNGASATAAGGNAASRLVNESRSAFFFDDQVLNEVESFTFVNGDPVSDICQSLAGQTFRSDDPNAARYFPPLHMNCKSYIVPNLVGDENNPDITGLKTKFEPSL